MSMQTLCAKKKNIMLQRIIELFERWNQAFIQNQADLILDGVSERCLCGALMTCIRYDLDNTEFSNYHADIEYNRNFSGRVKTIINDDLKVINITCDLIIHSRGENIDQDNLLAIEMKRSTHRKREKTKDKNRLIALTKPIGDDTIFLIGEANLPAHVCGYILGVFYEINKTKRIITLEYYVLGALYQVTKIKF